MNKEFMHRLKTQIDDGELSLVATTLAYTTVLSLIPFLAVCLVILQKMGGLDVLYPKVQNLILSNFPDISGTGATKFLQKTITRMISGKISFIGALALILTATRMISVMEHGINRVWNIKKPRPWAQRVFFYWILILAIPFGLASIVTVNSMKTVTDMISRVPGDVFRFSMLFALLFFVYRIVPNIEVRWRWAWWGAIAGTISVLTVHKIFIWSAQTVFNYGKLYGSIAAIPLFLLWVLLVWYGILFGAIVSASAHKGELDVLQS